MRIEIIEGYNAHSNIFIHPRDLNVRKARDFEAYVSMFPFSDGIEDHVKVSNDFVSFQGDLYCKTLWFDIDNKDLNKSLKSARELYNRLVNVYKLNKYAMHIYFSGNKGFHIGLSAKYFGGFQPNNKLPYQIKKLVTAISDGIDSVDLSIYNPGRFWRLPNSKHAKSNFYKIPLSYSEFMHLELNAILILAQSPRIDFKRTAPLGAIVANKNCQKAWLLANTVVERTATEKKIISEIPEQINERFKVAVKLAHKKYSIDDYFNNNRNNFMFLLAAWCNDLGIGEAGKGNETLELIVDYCLNTLRDDESTWDLNNVEKTILGCYKRYAMSFGQHEEYLKLHKPKGSPAYQTRLFIMDKAKRLSRIPVLTGREKMDILRAFNAIKEESIPEDDLYAIFFQAGISLNKRNEDNVGRTMVEMVDEYVEVARRQKGGALLGIDVIDEIMDYNYEGTVVAIIGKAGTKKSMILKDILLHNAKRKIRGVYSSMEQTALEQFMRTINGVLEAPKKETKKLGGIGIESSEQSAPMQANKAIIKDLRELNNLNELNNYKKMLCEKLKSIFEDYLILDEVNSMGEEDYEELIDLIIEKYGSLSIVGIDGLSMMDDKNSDEVKASVHNSKAAKNIAKKYKLMVPLLIHVPSDVKRTQRWLEDKTRGGSKIADNVDVFLSLSMIERPPMFNEDVAGQYFYNEYVYCAFWAKRRGGDKVEFILYLNPITLGFERVDISLEELEDGITHLSKMEQIEERSQIAQIPLPREDDSFSIGEYDEGLSEAETLRNAMLRHRGEFEETVPF